jgi:hypothetical protein
LDKMSADRERMPGWYWAVGALVFLLAALATCLFWLDKGSGAYLLSAMLLLANAAMLMFFRALRKRPSTAPPEPLPMLFKAGLALSYGGIAMMIIGFVRGGPPVAAVGWMMWLTGFLLRGVIGFLREKGWNRVVLLMPPAIVTALFLAAGRDIPWLLWSGLAGLASVVLAPIMLLVRGESVGRS